MDKLCSFTKADFCNLPYETGTIDAVYAIEATCHAPSKEKVYGEIFRVLKPGSCFAAYDWCMTPKYDSNNAEHVRIKKGIEKGNALPTIPPTTHVVNALRNVGFEVLELTDFGEATKQNPVPWYDTLAGKVSVTNFRFTRSGRWLTDKMVGVLETLKIAPKGSAATSKMLNDTAECLVEGGELGIFTPSYFFVVRKPLK